MKKKLVLYMTEDRTQPERQKPCTTKQIRIFRIWKYIHSLQVAWNETMPMSASVFKRESRKQCNLLIVTREKGEIWSKQKAQTYSPIKIVKQAKKRGTLSIMTNSVWHYRTLSSLLAKIRIILVPMSFARLTALWINVVKTSNILVRFLKSSFWSWYQQQRYFWLLICLD